MTAGGFLDKDDLRRLALGRARASGQEAWLQSEGIPFKRQGNDVLVLWTHVQAWMEGRPTVRLEEPDFSYLERMQ